MKTLSKLILLSIFLLLIPLVNATNTTTSTTIRPTGSSTTIRPTTSTSTSTSTTIRPTTIKTTIPTTIRARCVGRGCAIPLGITGDTEFYLIAGVIAVIVLVIIYWTFKYFLRRNEN